MFSLELDSAKCVRAVTKFATCDKCSSICPTSAIAYSEDTNLPSILPSSCVNCGGCVGSCPSEALTLDFHHNTNFFFDFVESEETLLSCKKNLPCLAVLSSEHLLALGILKEELILDVGHCESCEIKEPLYQSILDKADQVNYILEAIASPKRVRLQALGFEPHSETTSRRGFLEKISLKEAVKAKKSFDKETELDPEAFLEYALDSIDVAQIRNKQFPDKRKILFTALKRVDKPEIFHVIDANDVSFTSIKKLDYESCTACQMCYRICPTGALSSDYKNSKIMFDPFMCIKCHICHDVCEPNALTLSETYPLQQFFEPTKMGLVEFNTRKCNECGMFFDYRGGEVMCNRCRIEEEEARELWGLS